MQKKSIGYGDPGLESHDQEMSLMKSTRDIEISQQLIGRYVPGCREYCTTAPTLSSSLALFSDTPEFKAAIQSFGSSVSCLFQGYSSPGNAHSLRVALSGLGIEEIRILAVDRLCLPRIYSNLGVEMPEMDFIQHDACALESILDERRFDLVIQDFTLNCMPPSQAPSLLRAAHALLGAKGICLISVSCDATNNRSAPLESLSTALTRWPNRWSDSTWGLSDMAWSDQEFKHMANRLAGRTFLDEINGCVLQITEPSCQFEFFESQTKVIAMIERAGFHVTVVHAGLAVDYSGLTCTRARIIATPL
ncbi:class I SAM-dependent methyltransferase [Synechococcus sp. CBW1006]|uniref:class I SAM-dependent methyltransferase n=1 Tax=Synechococcus sp. CBW1006 TaxID=1353138 RepID=UPI0018CE4945|nr:class I SAM-dependent methyltransferase [Synechococcus sp. CBW1006]QPN65883.1 class I SAM-dependent methyltransferase [Synechococcus sp. CBW1006]